MKRKMNEEKINISFMTKLKEYNWIIVAAVIPCIGLLSGFYYNDIEHSRRIQINEEQIDKVRSNVYTLSQDMQKTLASIDKNLAVIHIRIEQLKEATRENNNN
jgi:hypothetical protein